MWRLTGDRRAARASALTGQLIGAGLIALGVAEMLVLLGGFVGGFVGGLWLMLIGWFLVRAAAAERQVAAVRDRLRGRQVGDVARPVAAVPAGAPLAFAVDALLAGGGSNVVAVAGPDGIVGAVTIAHLRAVPDEERAVQRPVHPDDIGGPSAGPMTALAVDALATGVDLTGGRTVAGTGTIDAQGRVGPVGGIAQKVAAASAAGASVMLVPDSEAAAARRAAEGLGIEVVAVPSFSAALARLRALPPA